MVRRRRSNKVIAVRVREVAGEVGEVGHWWRWRRKQGGRRSGGGGKSPGGHGRKRRDEVAMVLVLAVRC